MLSPWTERHPFAILPRTDRRNTLHTLLSIGIGDGVGEDLIDNSGNQKRKKYNTLNWQMSLIGYNALLLAYNTRTRVPLFLCAMPHWLLGT